MNDMISIVVPVYNEEQNIAVLYGELLEAFSLVKNPYEIIFIDDGSIDKSQDVICGIAKADSRVKAIIFTRNYGQTSAICAGIDHAKGKYIMTIDADLQNDPRDVVNLLKKMDEGFDLACGWRKRRKDPFLNRRLPSMVANGIISALTGLKLHDYGCTLKMYRRDALKNVNLYGEMHRFIPVYVSWVGGKITEVEVNHRERKWGKSKYGINRTAKVVFDLITVKFLLGSSSTSPLYFFGGWGLLLMIIGILCGVTTLAQKLVWGLWVHKNPLLLLSIFSLMLGTQIILMGLLAELSVRIYYETTKKTIYIVDKRLNC